MHALDERVLRHDETVRELGGVVLDSAREPAALELGEQPGLAEVGEPHCGSTPLGGRETP